MVALGNECGVNTRALLSSMDSPLGRSAGNWLEVKEAVHCLEGKSQDRLHDTADLRELVLSCAAHLLVQTGKARDLDGGRKQAQACLASGAPKKKWDEMIVAHGANLDAFNQKLALDHTAPVILELKASSSGYLSRCDARIIGEVVRDLGAGRLTKDSVINHDVGIDQLAKPGDEVHSSGTLARIHAANAAQAAAARDRLKDAFEISDKSPERTKLIQEVVQ
jgi:thymidine phosphorylase